MTYSKNFERDWNWYFNNKELFIFNGSIPKKINEDIINGKSAKECFYLFDSQGKIYNTKELELLNDIFRCKASINFQIKEWAQDRAKGYLPKIEFDLIIEEFKLLDWMIEAVENQKYKYYE